MLKLLIWIIFVGFSAYTLHCVRRENFFASVRKVWALYWGRQVTMDLYVGLFLSLLVLFAHEQSTVAAVTWALFILVFGNPVTLLYVGLNFDGLVARIAG
jgi:hypothetical protein